MPSTLPSSFASAAAGNGSDSRSTRAPRGEDAGMGEWGRPRNGATQTFRRSSNAPPSHHRESSAATPSTSAFASTSAPVQGQSSHASGRNGGVTDTRYSKDQLLELFRDQRDAGDLDNGVSHLYVGDAEPGYINGQSQGRWSRREDTGHDNATGLEICFERNVVSEPLGLTDMTVDDIAHFTSSVNSPLKAPNTNTTQREGQGTRKMSLSHGSQPAGSPATGRPLNRRRELSESTMTSSKGGRDDNTSPPPSLTRRRTDIRDNGPAIPEERGGEDPAGTSMPFGGPKRTSTGTFGGLATNGPSSPWSTGPQSGGGLGAMGSFGSFALGTNPIEKARPGAVRSESRFKGMMSRDSNDDMNSVGEKGSTGNLGRVDESSYTGEHQHIGSAALGGDSPQQSRTLPDYMSPQRQRPGMDHGFGMNGSYQGQHAFQNKPQMGNPDMSPTFTNPYQSPEQGKARLEENEADDVAADAGQYHLPGLGGFGRQDSHAAFNDRMANAFEQRAFDRSQAGSAMGNRAFSGLPGLGGLGALGSTDPASVRSPGALQSPALANLGAASFGAAVGSPGGLGSVGRGASRLGSLFPSGMQDQMRTGRGMDEQSDGIAKTDENAGAFGNQGFGQMPPRETESPFRGGRGKFDDFFGAVDKQAEYSASQMLGSSQPLGSTGQPHGPQRMPSNVGSVAEREPPASQQKTMVMPDRIRWIYRDPQGNTQGPWSGLEMHDWYRAGFFSPELLVKKYEDQDYEPLAQLIRRIGNSREPFLVPQIGIPGPVNPQSAQPGGQAWPAQAVAPPPAGASQAQPPFASSFPSFGTTLTAEQQNALERRKQEEQYLMARQKEHLAQQQIMVKQMQTHGMHGQNLQHHSSAQSLHSQPSHGSITSPAAYNAALMPGLGQAHGMGGGFDNAFRGIGPIGSGLDSLSNIKEEDVPGMMGRLNIGQEGYQAAPGPANQAMADHARLQQEQADDPTHQQVLEQAHGDSQRLKQFHSLQQTKEPEQVQQHIRDDSRQQSKTSQAGEAEMPQRDLTLTEQVQKAASAKQSPAVGASPWTNVKQQQDEPTTVAPPQSSSPLPAPAARRNQKHVAEQLAAESISQSASPSLETPTASVAPWARESSETQKQPSLKEIQEAEARRAAKLEEMNAATRRAALEREVAAAQAAIAPAPGLPTSSTWGNADSPSTVTGSPWGAKAPVGKSATPATQARKTLQQIQKEEEALARKQKAAALAAQSASLSSASPAVASLSSGKRYADLASKVSASSLAGGAPSVASGWSTVGASGKAKAPAAAAAAVTSGMPGAMPALNRSVSGSVGRSVSNASVPMVAKPTPPGTLSRSTTGANMATGATARDEAMDSFRKWAIAELRPDLHKGMDPSMFVNEILLSLPADSVAEAVHQSSQTMDSRHFAEEFVRRRTLAEKGKLAGPQAGSGSSTAAAGSGNNSNGPSGWSEVARKGPAKTPGAGVAAGTGIDDGMFKVVPAKKKGAKK